MDIGFRLSTFVKIIAGVVCILFIYELNRNYSLYYPDHLFGYEARYRNFTLYSNQPVDRDLYDMMEDVSVRMKGVEIYDPGEPQNIYFVHEPQLYRSFAKKVGVEPSSRSLIINPPGYILINFSALGQRDFKKNSLSLQSDTAFVISHELVHLITDPVIDFLSSRSLSGWKQEGYAGYAASGYSGQQDSTDSFPVRVDQFMEETDNMRHSSPIRSRLMVEYLMNIRNMSFESFKNMDTPADSVFSELTQWYRQRSSG